VETTEEAQGLRPGLLLIVAGLRSREEQPGQGDVLEFAQVAELIPRRQPRFTGPPTGFAWMPHGDPHAGQQRRTRADVGEEVADVQALCLFQQSECFRVISLGLPQPCHGYPPSIGMLWHRRVLTELLALEEKAPGTLQVVALTENLAHRGVHVGRSPHERSALLRHKRERLLVGAQGVAQAPLDHADVAQREGGPECVRDVPRPLEPCDALAPCPMRRSELATGPERDAEKTGSAGPHHVVVVESQLEGPLGVLDGSGDIASNLCQPRPKHRDVPGNPTQLPRVCRSRSLRRVHSSLRVVQAVLDTGQLSARQQRAGEANAQDWTATDDLVGEWLHPCPQLQLLPRLAELRKRRLDQCRRSLDIATGECVADRLSALPVLLIPLARPVMQIWDLVAVLLFEVGAQDIGEEAVVAVPLASVVERDYEQVGSIELLQNGLAGTVGGDGVAELPTELLEDARAQQEASDRLGLAGEYLLDQVIDDIAVVPGEPGDEVGDVVASLHRKRC
jgi:hypothetical protein